jgi:predicted helicase
MTLHFEELQNAIFARMVKKVGDKKIIGKSGQKTWRKLNVIWNAHYQPVKPPGQHNVAFANFLEGLQKKHKSEYHRKIVSSKCYAKHIITKPVFEALFEGYSFVKKMLSL